MLLTSTQVDEEAQHFYRKLGYKDCGGFVIDVPGYEQPMEMFLIKRINKKNEQTFYWRLCCGCNLYDTSLYR